jgi:hypothetical protein
MGQNFSHFSIFQTGSGVYQKSYPIGIGLVSPKRNWLGREADHSLLSIAENKNAGAYTSIPHTSSRRGA